MIRSSGFVFVMSGEPLRALYIFIFDIWVGF